MMNPLTPFHVALPVRDLGEARAFYGELLQCPEGRSAPQWVDFNLFGHQLVCHLDPGLGADGQIGAIHNPVDGHSVPVPHCGVVLDMTRWQQLAARLQSRKVDFIIEPYVRFRGDPGEQATMFFRDPSGNALEFKAFRDMSQLFAV